MAVHVYFAGRLTADPEVRDANGKNLTRVRVAASEGFDKDHKEVTGFYTVNFWEKYGEPVAKYFHKGDQIIIAGELQHRQFQGQDGMTHEVYDVSHATWEFGAKSKANGGGSVSGGQTMSAGESAVSEIIEEGDKTTVEEDELPFD